MQSSTAIAFRALVMLIIMISVPLLAIFGKDLPEVVKGVLEGRSLVLGPPRASAGKEPGSSKRAAGNEFAESVPYRAPGGKDSTARTPRAAPPATSDAPIAAAQPASAPSVYGQAPWPSSAPGGTARAEPTAPPPAAPNGWPAQPQSAQPANFEAAADTRPLGADELAASQPVPTSWPSPDQPPASNAEAAINPSSAPAPAGVPVESRPPAAWQSPSTPSNLQAPAASAATPSPTTDSEQFRWAERRLRELGATHYMLETWGPENNRYRFVCKMALGGNPAVNRYFQAIDDDPWRAMEVVLRQVEDWRTQPQQ